MPNAYLLWFALLCLQILLGALVAGLHAGLVYNSWPDMNGMWLPPELSDISFANPVLVQFIHRKLAIFLAVGFIFWWYAVGNYVKNHALQKRAAAVAILLFAQFALGVATLLSQVALPLALLHQMTALALFAAAIILLHGMTYAPLRKPV